MRAEDTGLRLETIVHSVTLFQRVCARLLMNGWQLNTGLFYAVPPCWDWQETADGTRKATVSMWLSRKTK